MICEVNKISELLFGIQAVTRKKYGCIDEDYDFIEIPKISYFDDLYNLLKDEDLDELKYFFDDVLEDQADTSNLVIAIDDEYNLKYIPKLKIYGNFDITYYVDLIRNLAVKVNWNEFYDSHKDFYNRFLSNVYRFPDNLNLDRFKKFMGQKFNNYYYFPSVLFNGGFGPSNNDGCFYFKGFKNYDEKKFLYDYDYLLETLFHEYSHPVVNPIVDKYIDLINNKDELLKYSLDNNLVPIYNNINTLLFEYMVRTFAYIFTLDFYPNYELDDYIIDYGFILLPMLVEKVSSSIDKYDDFESIYVNEIIPFINGLNLDNENRHVLC